MSPVAPEWLPGSKLVNPRRRLYDCPTYQGVVHLQFLSSERDRIKELTDWWAAGRGSGRWYHVNEILVDGGRVLLDTVMDLLPPVGKVICIALLRMSEVSVMLLWTWLARSRLVGHGRFG